MRIYKTKDYDALSRKAASVIAAQVTLKPDSVLGLATGSSPLGTYKYLIERFKDGELDFSEVKTANLDEYRGLTRENTILCTTIYSSTLILTWKTPTSLTGLPPMRRPKLPAMIRLSAAWAV